MEWVETTGPSVEAALDAALDELGVDEEEVEYEVVAEAKSGLFRLLGASPARVRARVKPISREKPGDRGRSRSRSGRRNGDRSSSNRGKPSARSGKRQADESESAPLVAAAPGVSEPSDRQAGTSAPKRRRRRSRGGSNRSAGSARPQEESDVTTIEDVPIGEQADVADEFMRGLVAAFGLEADVAVRIEDETVLVDVEGGDIGLLVGPKGATLRAIEDLVRTVVQRRTDGHGARIHVDVGGYQAKRRAALAGFAAELAERVRTSRQELALEPMPPADRKVVHDTVAEIEGVTTSSEGEEPRRRVVLRPA